MSRKHDHHDHDQQDKLERAFMLQMLQSQKLILRAIKEILSRLPPPPKKPTHMNLKFGQPSDFASRLSQTEQTQGETMSTNPVPGVETDVQTIPCSALETDEDGTAVTLNPANVTWSIAPLEDGTSIAEITPNSADGSAKFRALKVGGPSVVSCVDSGVTLPDGTQLTGTNTLEIKKSTKTASKLALVWGDPTAATA